MLFRSLLRRGAAAALAWFGAMTFSFFGALVWLGWFAMMTGVPAQIARNFAKLEPGHVPQFQWSGFALACLFTYVTPWVRTLTWPDSVWFGWYIKPVPKMSVFTFFPWTGFVFAGAFLGEVLTSATTAAELTAGLRGKCFRACQQNHCAHKQLFVTNHEDGKIYRIQPVGPNAITGTVVQALNRIASPARSGWEPVR